jgi:tight adherence protein B
MNTLAMHAMPLPEKALLLALLAAFAAFGCYAICRSTRVARAISRYVESLDAPLRRMLMPPRGRLILSLQTTFVLLLLGCAVSLRSPTCAAFTALIVPAPRLLLMYVRKKRRDKIEAKLDVFALALANATRATPSVGRALQILQTSLTPPIDAEVAQVLRELRIGSSLEQALLNFSWRVESPSLDALLSSVLIARKVGGDLPCVLETTAATLREMMRLEGVLRSKTAQARTQMWVLACIPPVLVMAFELVKPGYYEPMTSHPLGVLALCIAGLAWMASIMLARKILAVEL